MEKDFKNSNKSEFEDESFRLDDMDEYPGELPNSSQQSKTGSQKTEGRQQTAVSKQKSVKGPVLALLLIAGLAMLIMFSSLIYDWGVNRGGFDDIAAVFDSKEKVIEKEEEIIIEKDLPEYDEYMKSQEQKEDDIVYEDESIEQSDVIEKPETKAVKPETQRPKDTKPPAPKQTQSPKRDLEDIPYPDNVTNRIKKSNVKEAEQLFTVQVYATPSKDDAEAWKEKLLKQNIADVSITQQKIKNRDWFRIRFGTFKTVEEARTAANKSGFAHSWIDRVK